MGKDYRCTLVVIGARRLELRHLFFLHSAIVPPDLIFEKFQGRVETDQDCVETTLFSLLLSDALPVKHNKRKSHPLLSLFGDRVFEGTDLNTSV